MRLNSLAGRRGKAYALDSLTYLGIAAATVSLGPLVNHLGWGRHRGAVLALSALSPILATVLAARQESGPYRATWGKRRIGLEVVAADGGSAGFGQSLVRNTLKIGIPWQVGHVVAVGAAFGGFEDGDIATFAAAGLTYPMIGVLIGAVVLGQGRSVPDRLARTAVRSTVIPTIA